MVEIPNRVKETLDRYLTALRENNIPVNRAILFGSYANGKFNDWSDIDIAIVSDIFEGSRIRDRSKIRRITLSVSCDIEVLPYKTDDFNEDDPFVREIIETGIRIV